MWQIIPYLEIVHNLPPKPLSAWMDGFMHAKMKEWMNLKFYIFTYIFVLELRLAYLQSHFLFLCFCYRCRRCQIQTCQTERWEFSCRQSCLMGLIIQLRFVWFSYQTRWECLHCLHSLWLVFCLSDKIHIEMLVINYCSYSYLCPVYFCSSYGSLNFCRRV